MFKSNQQLLKELERSRLLAEDFPKRLQLTYAQYEKLEIKPDLHEKGIKAIKQTPDFQYYNKIVCKLGEKRYEPAIEVLGKLWTTCALVPVRNSAGHALRKIGTDDARAILIDTLYDIEDLSTYLGVRALFDIDPATSFDRLSRFFDAAELTKPGGVVVAHHILGVFSPSTSYLGESSWNETRAPQWLRGDSRWIERMVALRKCEQLGREAREVLRHVEEDLYLPYIEAERLPQAPEINTAPIGNLLARYNQGEFVEVWETLRSLGSMMGDLREEALQVARATMVRLQFNLKLLLPRFEERGWKSLSGKLHMRPEPDDRSRIDELVRIAGSPIPPGLLAFWQVIGGVDLVWDYAQDRKVPKLFAGQVIALDDKDPLCIDSPLAVSYLLVEWKDRIEGVDPELYDPFPVYLSPDYLHKANLSGGAPYGIDLPTMLADPLFTSEEDRSFIEYLRYVMKWAGFAKLEAHEASPGVRNFVTSFTRGFEPF